MDETEILKANRKRKLALGYLIVGYTIIKKLGPLVAIDSIWTISNRM